MIPDQMHKLQSRFLPLPGYDRRKSRSWDCMLRAEKLPHTFKLRLCGAIQNFKFKNAPHSTPTPTKRPWVVEDLPRLPHPAFDTETVYLGQHLSSKETP
jgi:hypothetical protein